jgi:sterol desaturase/sphingolipid hydroxylase (fatty acid hydroxylase superfamily)
MSVLFENLAKLSLTKTNARLGLVCDTCVAITLMGLGLTLNAYGGLIAVATVVTGMGIFSFVEYAFHRWLFHGQGNSVRDGHDKHHADPHGYDALPFFLPPLGMIGVAIVVAMILPVSIALILSGALAAGYAAYGVAHTIIHSMRFRAPIAVRWAANHHIHHRHPDSNFGVTSPLWDRIFGTRYVSARTTRTDDQRSVG